MDIYKPKKPSFTKLMELAEITERESLEREENVPATPDMSPTKRSRSNPSNMDVSPAYRSQSFQINRENAGNANRILFATTPSPRHSANSPRSLGVGAVYPRGFNDEGLKFRVVLPGQDPYPTATIEALIFKIGIQFELMRGRTGMVRNLMDATVIHQDIVQRSEEEVHFEGIAGLGIWLAMIRMLAQHQVPVLITARFRTSTGGLYEVKAQTIVFEKKFYGKCVSKAH